jgi:polynucleotide 5'-kinase involved in rRNA processing
MVEHIDTQIKDLSLDDTSAKEELKSSAADDHGGPLVLIVLGMAGSGKTTFV